MASVPARRRGAPGSGFTLLALALSVLPLAATSACYDFTYRETATDGGDAAPPAASDGSTTTCVSGGAYCGGDHLVGAADTLYRCLADGGSEPVKTCASGCERDAGNGDGARCKPPATPCQAGGAYCGGDKLDGDPGVLYRCVAGGTPTVIESCAKGCRVMPAGSDDECNR